MMKSANDLRIKWSDPCYGEAERTALLEVFDSGWITQGSRVGDFEQQMKVLTGFENNIAVANGTVAIELLLRSLGIGTGDEVIVPAMTFFATAAAVVSVGATPVFVDIAEESFNIDPQCVQAALTQDTRAILSVDLGGVPCQHERLKGLAEDAGVLYLHDGAQSLGAEFCGRPSGSTADASTTSFHAAKLVAIGEGGMISCSDRSLALKLRSMRNQGAVSNAEHHYFGSNARMTDLQAAIGLAQLSKLRAVLEHRRRLHGLYVCELTGVHGLSLVDPSTPDARPSCFMFRVLSPRRDDICAALRAAGIGYRLTYPRPLYLQPAFLETPTLCRVSPCPIAEQYAREVISLPMHWNLTSQDVTEVSSVIRGALT